MFIFPEPCSWACYILVSKWKKLGRVKLSLCLPQGQKEKKSGLKLFPCQGGELSPSNPGGSSLPVSVACLAKADWLPNSQRQSRDESALTRWSWLRVRRLTAQVLREMETQQITFRPLQEKEGRRRADRGNDGGGEGKFKMFVCFFSLWQLFLQIGEAVGSESLWAAVILLFSKAIRVWKWFVKVFQVKCGQVRVSWQCPFRKDSLISHVLLD